MKHHLSNPQAPRSFNDFLQSHRVESNATLQPWQWHMQVAIAFALRCAHKICHLLAFCWADFHSSSCKSQMCFVFSPSAGWDWRPEGMAESGWPWLGCSSLQGKNTEERLVMSSVLFFLIFFFGWLVSSFLLFWRAAEVLFGKKKKQKTVKINLL